MSHRARKRFGQHFLHDPRVIERIVRAIDPQPGQTLVEIGPGLGAMTRPLLTATGAIDVIEIDRDVIPELEARCAGGGELRVHQIDALDLSLTDLGPGPFRLVGNLPYNISTPLLFHLLAQGEHIRDMHFMLQKEVVDRLVAQPGSRTYGRLGVMAALSCTAERLFDVPPGAFQPRPRVISSVVRLTPRQPDYPIPDPQLLADLIRRAFSRRRKTLRNALREVADTEIMVAVDIDPGKRPETLAPEDFARLAEALHRRDASA